MYRCPVKECDTILSTKYSLDRHLENIHLKRRNFRCPICYLNFFTKYNYERHIETYHHDRKVFKCHLCPAEGSASKAFGTKWNLNRHIEQYHRDRTEKWVKRNEERIKALLHKHEIDYTRELSIPIRGCVDEKPCGNRHYARLDFCIQDPRFPRTVTILSVDENQHRTYGDLAEIARMLDTVTAIQLRAGTDPLWEQRPRHLRWVRYNPDSYRVNGYKRQKTQDEREIKLIEILREPPNMARELELIYAFYSLQDGRTFIEESMPEMLAQCVTGRFV